MYALRLYHPSSSTYVGATDLMDAFVTIHQQYSPKRRRIHPHLTCAVVRLYFSSRTYTSWRPSFFATGHESYFDGDHSQWVVFLRSSNAVCAVRMSPNIWSDFLVAVQEVILIKALESNNVLWPHFPRTYPISYIYSMISMYINHGQSSVSGKYIISLNSFSCLLRLMYH